MKQRNGVIMLFGIILILSGCSNSDIQTPTVSTVDVTNITEMTAVSGGIISTVNGSIIIAQGVCWSTSPNPTIADNKIESTVISTDTFTCNLTGLNPKTTYYVRAYITNSEGTMYGDEQCFTTLAGIPIARFEYVDIGWLKVSFSNNSDYPTSCFWDFGDGTTSTENSPTHVYKSIGLYHVTLTVSNSGLSNLITKSINVTDIVSIDKLPLDSYNGLIGRYIDVDGDSINDFFTYGYSHTGPSQSYSFTGIMPLSNYEVVCDSLCNIDPTKSSSKVIVPKIFVFGKSISILDKTISAPADLYFTYNYWSWSSGSFSYDILGNDGIKYVGFIKRAGDNSSIGWIKFKTVSTLYTLKIPSKCSSLLIDK